MPAAQLELEIIQGSISPMSYVKKENAGTPYALAATPYALIHAASPDDSRPQAMSPTFRLLGVNV
jgi:hypothetical protein